MSLAIEQAQQAEEEGEVPVGAIFVENKEVIASAGNASIQLNDPTAHAEIRVLRQAANKKKELSHWGDFIRNVRALFDVHGFVDSR